MGNARSATPREVLAFGVEVRSLIEEAEAAAPMERGSDGYTTLRSAFLDAMGGTYHKCGLTDGKESIAAAIVIHLSMMSVALDEKGLPVDLTGLCSVLQNLTDPAHRTSRDIAVNFAREAAHTIDQLPNLREAFGVLAVLASIDRESGTRYRERAEELLLRLGSLITEADGKLTAAKRDSVVALRALLRESASPALPSPQRRAEPAQSVEAALAALDRFVGMDNVKAEVRALVDFLKIEKLRADRGLSPNAISLHAVFVGPPGTGKTSVARVIGRIYRALGFLTKGHVIETDRAGLVAGFVGQTALKVDKVVSEATDGVLFIDEAYSLMPAGSAGNDFGQEAVDALLKRMEDQRGRLAVIVAGYPDQMLGFMEGNPGLKSRFNRRFEFRDNTPEELVRIFTTMAEARGMSLAPDAVSALATLLDDLYSSRDEHFGNGRLVRNLYEKAIERQATRLAKQSSISDASLTTLEADDISGGTSSLTGGNDRADADKLPQISRFVGAFLKAQPEARRQVGVWFLRAACERGLTATKPRDRNAIEIKEWTTRLLFGRNAVTFETGYGKRDVKGELAHHVAAMRAVPFADRWLAGPGQPRAASTFKVEIQDGNSEAFAVATSVFQAFAAATDVDERAETNEEEKQDSRRAERKAAAPSATHDEPTVGNSAVAEKHDEDKEALSEREAELATGRIRAKFTGILAKFRSGETAQIAWEDFVSEAGEEATEAGLADEAWDELLDTLIDDVAAAVAERGERGGKTRRQAYAEFLIPVPDRGDDAPELEDEREVEGEADPDVDNGADDVVRTETRNLRLRTKELRLRIRELRRQRADEIKLIRRRRPGFLDLLFGGSDGWKLTTRRAVREIENKYDALIRRADDEILRNDRKILELARQSDS